MKKSTNKVVKVLQRERQAAGMLRFVMETIQQYNLPFGYVGSGKVMVDNLIPDFVHLANHKKFIELRDCSPAEDTHNTRDNVYKCLDCDVLVLLPLNFGSDKDKKELVKILTCWGNEDD